MKTIHNQTTENTPLRIVFMGCPEFSVPCMEKLVNSPDFDVVAIYCMPDRPKGRGKKTAPTPIKARALELGIDVHTPATFRISTDPEATEILRNYNPDYLVVVAYGLILPQRILDIPKIAAVNLHASLLPAYRGPSPIHQSLIDGLDETGNTVMLMSRGMDEGDILATQKISIENKDTLGTLHDKLSFTGSELLYDTLKKYANGEITPQPQNHLKASYTGKISAKVAQIDWNKSSTEIINLIKAMSPTPGAWLDDNGERIKIFAATPVNGVNYKPGKVIEQTCENGVIIACGNNTAIRLDELQRPGKSRLCCSSFLLGCKINSEELCQID